MAKNKTICGRENPQWKNTPTKKASVDLRCAYCSEYQGLKCLGLLVYYYSDCIKNGIKGNRS